MMEQKTTQEKHDRAKYKLAASIKGVHENHSGGPHHGERILWRAAV